jgi:hypothetical protein
MNLTLLLLHLAVHDEAASPWQERGDPEESTAQRRATRRARDRLVHAVKISAV